jgi:hypothetical protein
MSYKHSFTLRQIDEARDDLYAISDEIEALKLQIASLPSRAYVSRFALRATATVSAVIGVVAMVGSATPRWPPSWRDPLA